MIKHLFIIATIVMALFLAPISAFSDAPVNINTASAEQLETMSGIGPVLAQKIIEHREQFPFEAPEDIMKVPGIGESKFANIQDMIIVE
ncbi:MAG: ComEA family DNA-binding protein [Desulfonatronovibrio sp.]